jgi:hypothetical protein
MANVITNENRLAAREIFIKNTHRGLWYEDGVLLRVLDAGRHVIPGRAQLLGRHRRVEVVLVDVRERRADDQGSGDPDLG